MKPRTYLVIAIIVALALGAASLSPFPRAGLHGRYNYASRLAYCDSQAICLHEIGHALDQASGFPSQGKAFGEALNIHLVVAFHADEPDMVTMQTLRDLTGRPDQFPTKSELYANLFMNAGGRAENMPADLQPYYDWQLAAHWAGQLRDGQRLYWLTKGEQHATLGR